MKTMKPIEQFDLGPDEEGLVTALREMLQQRAQAQHLKPAVRAQVLAAVAPQPTQSWWWRPAFAAAAVALVLLAAHFALRAPSTTHASQDLICMTTTPDNTVRIEWQSPAHVVIQRSAGWKERRLVVVHRNGTEFSGLFVAHPTVSLWK